MKAPVRLLHLEDNPSDGELISATLAREGMECEIQRVATRQGFVEQLEAGGCDLILADYNLPSFDGLSALKLARRRRPETPFLFVSGFIGEEVALESLKNGATDYVFKHNLARLAPAVRRALEEARERRERETAEAALHDREAALRSFFDTAPFMMGIVELGHDQLIHLSGNAASARFLGAAPAAMANNPVEKWGLPRNVIARLRAQCQQSQDEARAVEAEHCFPWQGKLREVALTVSPLPGTAGHGARCCYVAEEVTDKKQLERQFLRAQRLESVGTLASGLAHDLNNVLAPIMMSAPRRALASRLESSS